MRPTLPSVDQAAWVHAIKHVSDLAHLKLPEQLHGRVERGTALVLNGMVQPAEDGHGYQVLNSKGTTWYPVNGACPCEDHVRAPESLCKHRLAVMIHRRASEMLHAAQDATSPASVVQDTPEAHDATTGVLEGKNEVSGVPAQYLVWIQNKPFIRFVGLLQLAHEKGLTGLTETWTYNDAELSLAHAVATFQDGRTFEGSGDATPGNVARKVAPHFRRVALTRAKSRALRDALNLDMVAVEELAEGE